MRLLKGQRLILEAEACLGKAGDHAKWQAATGVGYRYYPEISIGDCDGCGECIDKCPKKILKLKKGKAMITNEEDCILCNSCSDVCPRDAIEVKGNPRKFFFNFETDGSLTARETLLEALDIFHEKCEEFGERMKSL